MASDNEVTAQPGRVELDAAEKQVIPGDGARGHAKSPGEWLAAPDQREGVAGRAVGTSSGVSRSFVVGVRRGRGSLDIGPGAGAGIDALARLELFEYLVVER